MGPRYQNGHPLLQNLHSWPVQTFEAIRIYYTFDQDRLIVIRILHGSRDVAGILGSEQNI